MSETVTKEKLVDDVKVVLHDADILLRETAGQLGDKARDARARLEKGVRAARERLDDIQSKSVEQVKATAKQADEFVHEHPWQSVGIAFAAGAILGLIVGRR